MKKKALLLSFLLVLIMIPVSSASDAGGKRVTAGELDPDWEMSFSFPARHRATVVDTLLNNTQFDWPWKYINDKVHPYYGYYTSMGCDDVLCRDPAHTHWCPREICQDKSHGHSDAEYAIAASYDPVCSCHKH